MDWKLYKNWDHKAVRKHCHTCQPHSSHNFSETGPYLRPPQKHHIMCHRTKISSHVSPSENFSTFSSLSLVNSYKYLQTRMFTTWLQKQAKVRNGIWSWNETYQKQQRICPEMQRSRHELPPQARGAHWALTQYAVCNRQLLLGYIEINKSWGALLLKDV
jgi:hypothetical protein